MLRFSWVGIKENRKNADGKTPETAILLDELHLPEFMKAGAAYQVITGPVLLEDETRVARCKVCLYSIRNIAGYEDIFYVESTVRLPRQFLVKRIVFGCRWYKYVPINTGSKAEQLRFLYPRYFAPA